MSEKLCGCEPEYSYYCANCFTSLQDRISELEEFKKEALRVMGMIDKFSSWTIVNIIGQGQAFEATSLFTRAREFMAKWDEKENI